MARPWKAYKRFVLCRFIGVFIFPVNNGHIEHCTLNLQHKTGFIVENTLKTSNSRVKANPVHWYKVFTLVFFRFWVSESPTKSLVKNSFLHIKEGVFIFSKTFLAILKSYLFEFFSTFVFILKTAKYNIFFKQNVYLRFLNELHTHIHDRILIYNKNNTECYL